MADPLVETKILRPRPRRGTVPRPRLDDLLARARDAPVTLVSAPAGFGKTTLLVSWLAADRSGGDEERAVAWVSLDERDRRADSFWSYLLAALERALPGCAASALTLLESRQASVEQVLTLAVNELSVRPGEVTVVLDDYHLAEGAEIAAGMAFLIDHLPPQLHLVLSTRADPVLPLARLRARGDLLEVRAADLRFTAGEVAAYLNDVHRLDLGGADVAALEARTEGWAAALQLAVLSLRDRSDASGFIDRFTGDDRFVIDYLADEVLQRQPDHVRRFLLDTAVLDRLSASLCEAVSAAGPDDPAGAGGADGRGRAMLDLLDRQNLFLVPLDDRRQWYRYHHLFADVLRAHLLQERPGEVAELHRRASHWYAEAGRPEDAVRHALAAGDDRMAADLVERAIPALRRERREIDLLRWVDAMSADVVRERPVLAVGFIGALMACNEFAGVDRRLRDVEQLLAGPAEGLVVADRHELARLPATIETFRAGLALVGGDPAEAVVRARRAAASAVEGDDLTTSAAAGLAGLASWTTGDLRAAHRSYTTAAEGLTRAGHVADALGCSLTLADLELALGRLHDAERTLGHALRLAAGHRPERPDPSDRQRAMRGTADMLVALSRTSWHRNDDAAAAELLRRADALGESAGLPQNAYRWRVAMARLRAAERDWTAALELLDEAERVYVGDFSPPVHPVHATRARVLAASGDVGAAVRWARAHRVAADDDLSYLREYEHITLAAVLLAEHRVAADPTGPARATALLDRLAAAAEAGGRAGSLIEIEVLRAQARRAAGQRDQALRALEHAVDLAEPDGWMRFFIGAGPPLHDLLRALAERRRSSGFVRELLAATAPTGDRPGRVAGDVVAGPAALDPRAPDRLLDPLSERELDVLRLLRSDLDGPGIARELYVSLNTVRTHTKHIYAKLGVTNRRAAVSRAHQLRLLSRAEP